MTEEQGLGWRLGHRPGLDGLRAIAVVVVVLNHTTLWGFEGGLLGVDVFFTLSGFLITSRLLEELADTGRLRLARFWTRRALRLIPALYTMVLAVVLLMPLLPEATKDGVVPTLLYVTNWQRAFGPDIGALGHTWSLGIEEQFYLLWPGLLLLLWRHDWEWRHHIALVLATAAAIMIWRDIVWYRGVSDFDRIYNGFDFRADGLLIGCALAMAMHAGLAPRWLRDRWTIGCAALTALSVFLAAEFVALPWVTRSVIAVATCVMISAACADERGVGVLSNPLLRWMGVRSYGFYLWHYPILIALGVGDGASPELQALAIGLSLAACALSYRFIETPFLRITVLRHNSPDRLRRQGDLRRLQAIPSAERLRPRCTGGAPCDEAGNGRGSGRPPLRRSAV